MLFSEKVNIEFLSHKEENKLLDTGNNHILISIYVCGYCNYFSYHDWQISMIQFIKTEQYLALIRKVKVAKQENIYIYIEKKTLPVYSSPIEKYISQNLFVNF